MTLPAVRLRSGLRILHADNHVLVVDKQLIVSEGDGEFTVHAGLVSRVAAVMFAAADADADGEISRDECVALLRSYTISAEDAREAFDAYDANGDGLMDEAEFAKMLREIEMDSVFSSCRCSNVKDAIRAFFVSGLGTTGAGAGAGAGGGAGRGAL